MIEPRPIQKLPASLVNKIAAGEVVERPASVVKELVENALDAGAKRVVLEVEEGGRALIRVTDDGRGMPADQLPLAFAPHATSKITDDADLDGVATLGFRGEALASIGEVSTAKITTRTPSDAAWQMTNDGGTIGDVQPAAGNVGTTVEIRDLFFNVPARRKFLKGAAAEAAHVTEVITKLALAHPEIAFRYVRDHKTIWDHPAGDPTKRWLVGWPTEHAEGALGVRRADGGYGVEGVVGLPEHAATHVRYQHLYVNGRPIRDRYLQHALKEAFRGLTEPGRHPAAVLMVAVPPTEIDVNVHPAKAEVRFRESGRVHALLLSAVREALLGADLTPRAQPRPEPAEPREDVRQTLAAFFKEGLESQVTQPRLEPTPPAEPEPQPPAPPPAVDEPVPAGAMQVHNSYLVVPDDDGMLIIDQHALHERVIFEDLLQRLRRGALESQALLLPMTFDADGEELAKLDRLRPLLARLGLEAEAFGPDSIAIRAFPSFLHRLDPIDFLRDVLRRSDHEVDALGDEALLHDVLDMMSCKAAVKAGDPLTPPEIDALLTRRALAARSSNCPHGRPTTLRLSIADLEKQFKRTGF